MQSYRRDPSERVAYAVWDRPTRLFHWINALCVIGLAALGLAILNSKLFGVSPDGKVLLKTLHVYVGYVFAVNLAWRLVWAFLGNTHARWRAMLPGKVSALRSYVRALLKGQSMNYLGHNPIGRLMVSLLLLLLLIQAVTGLVLAGTDLYKPPFGGAIANWVTNGELEKLANLAPASTEYVDQTAYNEMRHFRKPIVTTHLYAFYILVVAILLHIGGVVVSEIRDKSGLISAMFSGEKVLAQPPIDSPAAPTETRHKS